VPPPAAEKGREKSPSWLDEGGAEPERG
jgi:hypothetical protein